MKKIIVSWVAGSLKMITSGYMLVPRVSCQSEMKCSKLHKACELPSKDFNLNRKELLSGCCCALTRREEILWFGTGRRMLPGSLRIFDKNNWNLKCTWDEHLRKNGSKHRLFWQQRNFQSCNFLTALQHELTYVIPTSKHTVHCSTGDERYDQPSGAQEQTTC